MIEVAALRKLTELGFDLPETYENPFDPDEIAVDALVRSPSGIQTVVPCFYTQPHRRHVDRNGREHWHPSGPSSWAVRLAPSEPGPYGLRIRVRDGAGDRLATTLQIDVAVSDAPGPVRLSTDRRSLVREDGRPFIPIGMNLAWWMSPDPTLQMERVMDRMAEAGMNWSRLWLTHYGDGFTIEWNADDPTGHFRGLGQYSLALAARIDRILAEADRRGIAVQLVLWQHSQLASLTHSAWPQSPYNRDNGGPCAQSRDFFTDPAARRLSDQRIRYLVARYGAFPSLFAWEIFNEMDCVGDAGLEVVAPWAAERARLIRTLDAHRHLVTTSHAFPASLVRPAAFDDDVYDLCQCHVYAADVVCALERERAALASHGKPTLVGEMGLDIDGVPDQEDREGWHLHDATWAALALGYAGGAMSWWWDSYVDAQNHYERQRGAARFAALARLSELDCPGASSWSTSDPSLRVVGRASPSAAIAWATAGQVRTVSEARLSVSGMAPGRYEIEQWGTTSGEVVQRWFAQCDAGLLELELASFVRDAAIVVRPVSI